MSGNGATPGSSERPSGLAVILRDDQLGAATRRERISRGTGIGFGRYSQADAEKDELLIREKRSGLRVDTLS